MEPLIKYAAFLPQSVLDEMEKTNYGWTYVKICASISRNRHFLKYEFILVILAGRDTVFGTFVWIFLEFVKRPNLMVNLRREIENIIGIGRNIPRPIYNNLKSMRFVKNTLNEIFRLYPTVSLNLRTVFKNTNLPRGNNHNNNKPMGLAEGKPVIFSNYILRKFLVWPLRNRI